MRNEQATGERGACLHIQRETMTEVPNGYGAIGLGDARRRGYGSRHRDWLLDGEADMTIKRHNGEWRKISLDPAPEGQPMRRVVLDADGTINDRPVPHSGPVIPGKSRRVPAPKATPAPRSIYDEPWMRRILDGVAPPSPKRKRPGDGQGA